MARTGIRCVALEIVQVARHAGRAVQVVVVVDVAIGAGTRWHGMPPVSGKSGAVVVELRRQSSCCGVAVLAGLREARQSTWLGFVVPWKSFRWHDTQAVLFSV